jgi:Na+/phosphate symporter
MEIYARLLSWIGPFLVLIGSLLTVANAGARITGFGLMLFSVGVEAFGGLALFNEECFSLFVNSALLLINCAGVRRWLNH